MIPSSCFRLIVEPVLIVNTDHPYDGNQDQENVEENKDCDGMYVYRCVAGPGILGPRV